MIRLNLTPNDLSGVKAHIWQRISALYLLLYTPALAIKIVQLPPHDSLYALAHQIATPAFSLASLCALSLVLVHTWVGGRDILIDYLPRERLSLWLTLYRNILALVLINCLWILVTLFASSTPQ